MRRILLLGLCALALLGCDKGSESATEDQKADAAKPDAAKQSEPVAAADTSACQTACEHRKSCDVPRGADVTRCVEDCTMLSELLTADALAQYSKAGCEEVKQGEANFQTAALCRRACRHRSECLPDADAASCEGECAGLILVTKQDPVGVLQPYIDSGCDTVKTEEQGFQTAGSCLRACGKQVECGVRDDLGSCVGECAQLIADGKTNAAEARKFASQTCEQVRAQIPEKQPSTPMELSVAAGLLGNGCRSSGQQDCPYFSVCCRAGAYTAPGSGSGMCISPAICLMPRG
jgi:hypothetical protein